MLPWYSEAISIRGLIGVTLIGVGVMLINMRRASGPAAG